MATPEVSATSQTTAKKVEVTGYTGVKAGVVRTASNENFADAGAILGGEIKLNDKTGYTYLRGQIGAGTAGSAELALGHEFDIGKNMGLDLSAKAMTARSYIEQGNSSYQTKQAYSNEITNTYIESTSNGNFKWQKAASRLAAQAKLTFGGQKTKFGVGIEAGAQTDNKPTIHLNSQLNYSDYAANTSGEMHFYATPVKNTTEGYVAGTFTYDKKLGKHISLGVQADVLNFKPKNTEISATLKYNF